MGGDTAGAPSRGDERPGWRSALDRWFDERLGIDSLMRMPMPASTTWLHVLGGLSFFVLVVQFCTGILLAVYYRPTPEAAYDSVRFVGNHVSYGWLIRGIHHWGANAMVLLVLLHMLRVFFYGAYHPPRELNWISGMGLLLVTFGFAFTGYLLPWDQLSYWATTVGTQLTDAVPLLGGWLLDILRGGMTVGAQTLTRFYDVHTVVLPLAAVILLLLHFALERRLGLVEAPWRNVPEQAPDPNVPAPHGAGGEPFYPNHFWREGVAFCLLLAVLLGLVALLPPELHPRADPAVTPEHIKPEWYFLSNYQFLKLFPAEVPGLDRIPGVRLFLGEGRTISVELQGLAVLLLILLPFLDRNPQRNPLRRPVLLAGAIAIILAWIALTLWGAYS